ncbi:MAG: adenylate/guanylate cyclase domain-containing protein [Candidatus Daviesbacteria bacterium]|nr:adenylate/guanylate cyclase domain-containing protein [Candidatus Daviesbacteria bacterium]
MTNSNFLRQAAIRSLAGGLFNGTTAKARIANFIPPDLPKPTIPLPTNFQSFLPPIPQKVSSPLLPFLKPTVKPFIRIVSPEVAFMNGIRKEISDIVNDGIDQTLARVLPTIDSLGFGEGKMIKTAVLYIDIRDSSYIRFNRTPKAAAKIYMSFHRSMVKAGKRYGGQIGGFAGDRIMVIFPPTSVNNNRQRSNAVKTAILMQNVLDKIVNPMLNQKFDYSLTCGIGIDFGEMLVVKAGAYGTGNNDLIWTGDPANLASKLADEENGGIYISSAVYESMSQDLKDKQIWLQNVNSNVSKNSYMYLDLSN